MANWQAAAVFSNAQGLGEIERVEISVPVEEAGPAEKPGNVGWIVVPQPKRECGTALCEALWIGDPEHLDSRNFLQSGDQPGEQAGFVPVRCTVRCLQRLPAALHHRIAMPSKLGYVINRRRDAGDQFLYLRSCFPTFGRNIRGRPHL